MTPIIVKELTQTCYACPSQWQGITTDNLPVYIRYRHGYGSFSVNDREIFNWDGGGEFGDGILSYSELKIMMPSYVMLPEYLVNE